jgi:undecaprenyl-diphosphatase
VSDAVPTPDERAPGIGAELDALDQAVYAAIAGSSTPSADTALRRLSQAANRSVIWLAIAGGMAVVGGPRGRRAALHGVASIGVASAVVNLGAKRLFPRRRPDRPTHGVPVVRHVSMPESTSFPSGHSASAFAFAEGVAVTAPAVGSALRLLAAAVAYSRVHTGVHYPGDVLVGSLIGMASGEFAPRVVDRIIPPR